MLETQLAAETTAEIVGLEGDGAERQAVLAGRRHRRRDNLNQCCSTSPFVSACLLLLDASSSAHLARFHPGLEHWAQQSAFTTLSLSAKIKAVPGAPPKRAILRVCPHFHHPSP